MRHLVIAAAVAIGLAACSAPADEQSATPSDAASPVASASASTSASDPGESPGFAVTSTDFDDGGELPDSATANAFGGQCVGDNLNPELSWTGAPVGTQSFAVVMLDRSANNFIHWVQFDIPADALGLDAGGSDAAGGTFGATGVAQQGYFGPCPPGPDHRYEFTVYALDAMLDLDDGARFADVKAAIDDHLLAQASITGMRSGPA